ncbi:S1 family peptidase [Streptosporangium sp. NBC_01639]|uniref:S1 family peptidase n=1 Tax=Streptosporangium sp. NBC_01639 TaxID=2975948 RepID=UPI00386D927A|nr:S1 family peptidase [Streptosporangium sp. NBC_01639]
MTRRHTVTTGCVLAITALVLTAAPAVARPLPTDTAAPAALKPPPGMLEALQRDLHLTREQAQDRLLNETRLADVEAGLHQRLGDRFGGSWFVGTVAQTLVVTTTDPADLPQIIAAGARGEVVKRPLAELDRALQVIETAQSTAGGKVRYVDVRNNRIVILTSDPLATEDLIEATGVNTSLVQAVQSTEAPRLLGDVVGGDAYYVGTASRCSVGFSVAKEAQNGFITAGHCGTAGRTTVGANRTAQGTFQGSSFPDNDYAWVAVNSNWTPKPAVDNGTGGTVSVAGSREAIEGASVCRSGSTTGWHCGLIRQRNTSVTYSQGTITGMTRTNVCAEAGDSGGSFISVDQAQGVTSGGSGDCNAGGITYFQPINEILKAYDLTLLVAGDPPGAIACTDYPRTVTGTLTGGQSVNQPTRYYTTSARGFHSACLDANDTADFDLYLQKWSGRSWVNVATSDGPAPDEKIGYTGAAGFYRYRVTSSVGSGPYTLKYKTP